MPETKGLLGKIINLIWVLAFIIAILFVVYSLKNILFALLGIGLVIMIHESGHFTVAKVSGIKVEAFSIGFPPVLLSIKRTVKGFVIKVLPKVNKDSETETCAYQFTLGKKAKPGETEYRIGLIPFGGFVKMLGQEDTKEVAKSDDPRSYANKSPWIRMAVIAAGVIFNVISAVIIFMIVFLVGIKQTPAVVGDVYPGSPAAVAGLSTGDEIIAINGETKDLQFMNIAMAATMAGPNEPIDLKVKHPDDSVEDYQVVPVATERGGLKAVGIVAPITLEIAKVKDPNKMKQQTGLAPGDKIKAINGKDVQTYPQFEEIISSALAPSVTVLADRVTDHNEKTKNEKTEPVQANLQLTLDLRADPNAENQGLGQLYSMVPRLKIIDVTRENNLQPGDIIVKIHDTEYPTHQQMREIVPNFDGKPLEITVIRQGRQITVKTIPEKNKGNQVLIGVGLDLDVENAVVAKTIDPNNGIAQLNIPNGATITAVDGTEVQNFFDIAKIINQNPGQRLTIDYRISDEIAGDVAVQVPPEDQFIPIKSILRFYTPFEPFQVLYKAKGPINAIGMGFRSAKMFVVNSYQTLRSLILGYVSPKFLSGPIGIVTMSYQIIKEYPFVHYLNFIGLISACIAVFNSLPLLPFDGGHIVFLIVEKIKGSPINERVQAYFLYAGLITVLAFALYVTFNDVINLGKLF